MEDKRIKAVEQWPEPKSIRDIQIFLGFAKFYQQFIQGFSCIATSLTSMLKTTRTTEFAANSKKTKGKVSSNSVVSYSMVGDNEATNQANTTKRKK